MTSLPTWSSIIQRKIRVTVTDLNKQQTHDADPKAIKQIKKFLHYWSNQGNYPAFLKSNCESIWNISIYLVFI